MIIDSGIEALPSKFHVPSDGSGIGGVDPLNFGSHLSVGTNTDGGLLMYTAGNGGPSTEYPAWMWYPDSPRPILPNTGKLSLSYALSLYGSAYNAIETDTILVIGGKKFNLSGQNQAQEGFQIANAAGAWMNVGFDPVSLLDGGEHAVTFSYEFSEDASSVVSIQVDETLYAVPEFLQNVPAEESTWETGAYVQLQMSSVPTAPWWMAKFRKLQLTWA